MKNDENSPISVKVDLLNWVKSKTNENVSNFSRAFQNGDILKSIFNCNDEESLSETFAKAEALNIPSIINEKTIGKDELSTMLYIALIKEKLDTKKEELKNLSSISNQTDDANNELSISDFDIRAK